MKTKCGLYALSFALLCSVLLTPFFASSASAWTGNLPQCESYPDFMPALKADSRYSKDNTAYVAFKRDWSGPPYNGQPALFVVWDKSSATGGTNIIRFITNGGTPAQFGLVLGSGSNTSGFMVSSNGSFSNAVDGGAMGGAWDLNCVSVAEKVTYSPDWIAANGQTFPGQKDANLDPGVPCAFYDVACWVGDLTNNVVETIQDFWDGVVGIFERLIQFLGSLFVPSDENIFLNSFNDLNDFLRYKLGFLTFPFDFVANQISALMVIVDSDNKDEWHSTAIGNGASWSICAPNVFGTVPLCINFGLLEAVSPGIWTTGIWFVRLAVIMLLIDLMRKKYLSIVRG